MFRTRHLVLALSLACISTGEAIAESRTVEVGDSAKLQAALKAAKPGWRIRVRPGKYSTRVTVGKIQGTREQPIIVEATDPKNPPRFTGRREGLHISRAAYLVLRNLDVSGQSDNGINIDDGGTPDTPSHHIMLEGIRVSNIGPRGNHDGIKLSGVQNFTIRDCSVEGWGGQAIDMVGCHRGLIAECLLRGKKGYSQKTGVQMKGGTSDIVVRQCVFVEAGDRAANLGGSTGLRYFRPRDAKHEAKNLTVEGCVFVGSQAPIAFVGVDGATVRYNTIYKPGKWVMRILQETTKPDFVQCRNGRFEHNLVYFSSDRVRTAANVGPKTQPKTFQFAGNLWFANDKPKSSRLRLPTAEEGATYGIDPKFVDAKRHNFRPQNDAAAAFGAHAFRAKDAPPSKQPSR